MKNKKISHECPLVLMEESRQFNDYDYCLVHLFETHPEYYQFYVESLKMGRHVILDNSVFELGTAFEMSAFADWVYKLKPTEYIIPDVLNDREATIKNIKDWINQYGGLPGKKIGVVQGTSDKDLIKCYKEMKPLVDKIAFTDYSHWAETFGKWVKPITIPLDARMTAGRQLFLQWCLRNGVIDKSIPHHILGVHLPQEYVDYRTDEYDWIDTIDTSNPVVQGMLGHEYIDGEKLLRKDKMKLVELLEDTELVEKNRDIIFKNISHFRKIVNG